MNGVNNKSFPVKSVTVFEKLYEDDPFTCEPFLIICTGFEILDTIGNKFDVSTIELIGFHSPMVEYS